MTLQSCHSGLDPESSLFNLDSRFRGNDSSQIIVKPLLRHYTSSSEFCWLNGFFKNFRLRVMKEVFIQIGKPVLARAVHFSLRTSDSVAGGPFASES